MPKTTVFLDGLKKFVEASELCHSPLCAQTQVSRWLYLETIIVSSNGREKRIMATSPPNTDQSIRKATRRILNHLEKVPYQSNAIQVVKERAVLSSAEYIESNLSDAMLFPQKNKLWDYAASKVTLTDQMHLEFGVYTGGSINHFAKCLPNAEFHGFDSFEGLKEDWTGYHLTEGHFDLAGKMPRVAANVKLVPGWFDETVPRFLEKNLGKAVGFLHIDCDTYESTKVVLELLTGYMKEGTVVVFDEYYGYPNWKKGEYFAWQNWVKDNNVKYRYVAFSAMQAAVVITSISG